ncbi:Emi1p TDEL_0C06610 [Torulaspora delbrueckii]|uniref:Early meiotic induction protein 1 n=1 Tax=Torulaspora delbrueckii TaxID=4950 RepID=G8ZQR3_TORDE|nr:hypothetical protein TDEL_0C06610 [Torulaspora delbrueckii]CCE91550.1 hypothetical protein TDEL_0C06610 [Torulaspora delbrueckii]
MSTKYPSTMKCMEAFDQLTVCYSVGGQFRNYYRYGEFNACQKPLAKLKFCLVNGKDPVKVQEWHKDQIEYNKAHRGTSDDVWQER